MGVCLRVWVLHGLTWPLHGGWWSSSPQVRGLRWITGRAFPVSLSLPPRCGLDESVLGVLPEVLLGPQILRIPASKSSHSFTPLIKQLLRGRPLGPSTAGEVEQAWTWPQGPSSWCYPLHVASVQCSLGLPSPTSHDPG